MDVPLGVVGFVARRAGAPPDRRQEAANLKRHTSACACRAAIIALLPFALAACSGDTSPPADADMPSAAVAEAPPSGATDTQALSPAESTPGEGTPDAVERFDIESVPVSDAPLGDFPYFSLPAGYENPNNPKPIVDLDRVPFWTGDRMEWVEGRAFQSLIHAVKGKGFSPFEVEKNIEQLITRVGGVKVTDSKIPQDVLDSLDDSYTVGYSAGHGDIYNNPVQTYLVRRADREIWVHLVTDSASGGWIIAETQAFTPTATLLPASELKQQLDTAGKVALQVNFATDKAEILPDSKPQIDQVVQLLKDDPALELSVNGHTDNTGDAAHNQQLSEARAAAVVAALAAQGIAAERLDAKGFGQDQPLADNGTGEGKAKNRRVELVKAR